MDDFGKGYSSLSYLQSFPFDKIKIDRSFVSKLEQNPQSAAIVRAVLGLARGLGLPVLAEGVETEAELAFLAAEACDQVQGYLIGRPLPIEDYAEATGRPRPPSLPTRVRPRPARDELARSSPVGRGVCFFAQPPCTTNGYLSRVQGNGALPANRREQCPSFRISDHYYRCRSRGVRHVAVLTVDASAHGSRSGGGAGRFQNFKVAAVPSNSTVPTFTSNVPTFTSIARASMLPLRADGKSRGAKLTHACIPDRAHFATLGA